MDKKKLIPLVILIVAVLGFMLLFLSRSETEPVKAEQKFWSVNVVQAEFARHAPVIRLLGQLESPYDSQLTSALAAEVTALHVGEGEQVSQGQLLLTLDEADYQLVLAQKTAELKDIEAQIEAEKLRHRNDLSALEDEETLVKLSRTEVARQKDLISKNLGSQTQTDSAQKTLARQSLSLKQRQLSISEHQYRLERLQAQYQRASAQRDRAALDIQRTRITAPFNGIITGTQVAPGQRVQNGTPLLGTYNTEKTEIRAQIPLRYAAQVRAALDRNEKLAAVIESGGGSGGAVLKRLSGEIESGSGGIDGLFVLEDSAKWLSLGQTVTLHLSLPAAKESVMVPVDALYGTNRIYVVQEGRLRALTVRHIGNTGHDTGTILIQGDELRAGDDIVITQLPNAINGLAVRIEASPAG